METSYSGKDPNFLMRKAMEPPINVKIQNVTFNKLEYNIEEAISLDTIDVFDYVVMFQLLEQ